MIMVTESAKELKGFIEELSLSCFATEMMLRMVLAFIGHRGRMSCSKAAQAIRSKPMHRSQVTRGLKRKRWKRKDINNPARRRLLLLESRRRGRFLIIIDATLVGQAGQMTENTYCTGNRSRRKKKGRRHQKYKYARRSCHSFTFMMLITPSGYRIPFQMPHYTKEYCAAYGLQHLTTAEAAAEMIKDLWLPKGVEVYVLGDTAYDAAVVRQACEARKFTWVFPINPERVFQGPRGKRPRVRDRLKDRRRLSPQRIKMRPSQGPFAEHRRLSVWRVGLKAKQRTYSVHQETAEVRSVGRVSLLFSTKSEDLRTAKPEDVLILMTNGVNLSARMIVDLYSCRWQIELFFKELKSRLGFAQYRNRKFQAVEGWVETVLTTVVFLETMRAEKLANPKLSKKEKEWWRVQRLHGLCEAYIQQMEENELKFIAKRLQTPGGIKKLKQMLPYGSPKEYRHAG